MGIGAGCAGTELAKGYEVSELNKFGLEWIDRKMKEIEATEDAVYASIGAYDLEAFKAYCWHQREALTAIALRHQDDPEFQVRNVPVDDEWHHINRVDETPEFVQFERMGWAMSGGSWR